MHRKLYRLLARAGALALSAMMAATPALAEMGSVAMIGGADGSASLAVAETDGGGEEIEISATVTASKAGVSIESLGYSTSAACVGGDVYLLCDNLLLRLAAGADGREVIAALADTGSVVELGKGFTGAVTALGRMAGRTVAFVYTGKGDTCDKRMQKIARFVRFADCYNIPVVSLIDSTGLELFKTVDRQLNVVKAASKLVYAYSEATTVKVSVVIGNAIGAAYVAMGGSANADATYAWPGTCISPLTGEAAIAIWGKDDIKNSKGDAVAARKELAARYEAEVADGVNAAIEGLVDDVIDPADTRKMVIAALELMSSKRDSNPPKKHGNMPL